MPAATSQVFRTLALVTVLTASQAVQALWVVDVFDTDQRMTSLASVEALLSGTPTASGLYNVVNFTDGFPNTDGHFAVGNGEPNNPFPGGLVDTFAMRVTGTLAIRTDGDYTLGFDSDNGALLRLDGVDTVVDMVPHRPRTELTTTYLTKGNYALELIYFENRGGATIELFMADGIYPGFDPSEFYLITEGALPPNATSVPIPPSIVLMLTALGGLLLRARAA